MVDAFTVFGLEDISNKLNPVAVVSKTKTQAPIYEVRTDYLTYEESTGEWVSTGIFTRHHSNVPFARRAIFEKLKHAFYHPMWESAYMLEEFYNGVSVVTIHKNKVFLTTHKLYQKHTTAYSEAEQAVERALRIV